ncbi:Hypothetical protein RG540_CH43920 [Neorhizobium galegae bv. orientalis str. HAMBI 540]|uniref:Uncharacterized protein n=1 Tax=Neorhizobium galegae bv. orientalis str. HAMBI 540 TaxID=1028800 RepID=A0A068SWE0_NEOGA|nr:Hypothetical protein RG540_CH43920 [Neorhizobium galegae bv. orientalis str. HAMBI 540]
MPVAGRQELREFSRNERCLGGIAAKAEQGAAHFIARGYQKQRTSFRLEARCLRPGERRRIELSSLQVGGRHGVDRP